MFTHTGVLIEGRALRIESIEYPLDLQLVGPNMTVKLVEKPTGTV